MLGGNENGQCSFDVDFTQPDLADSMINDYINESSGSTSNSSTNNNSNGSSSTLNNAMSNQAPATTNILFSNNISIAPLLPDVRVQEPPNVNNNVFRTPASPATPLVHSPVSPFVNPSPSSPFAHYSPYAVPTVSTVGGSPIAPLQNDPMLQQQDFARRQSVNLNLDQLQIIGSPATGLVSPLGPIHQGSPFQSLLLSPYIVQLQTPQIWGITSPAVPTGESTSILYNEEDNVEELLGGVNDDATPIDTSLFGEFGLNTGGSSSSLNAPSGAALSAEGLFNGDMLLSSGSKNSATSPSGAPSPTIPSTGKAVKPRRQSNANSSTSAGSANKPIVSEIPPPIKIRDPDGGAGKRDILYQCPFPQCEKRFTRPYNLKSHYRSAHTKERPFACDQCSITFTRKHDLTRHQKLHQKEKPFKCNVCEKSFARSDALKRHLSQNKDGKGSACEIRIRQNGSDNSFPS